jgi:hypothetical protein
MQFTIDIDAFDHEVDGLFNIRYELEILYFERFAEHGHELKGIGGLSRSA